MLDVSPRLPTKRGFDHGDIAISRRSRVQGSASRPSERDAPLRLADRKLGNECRPPSRRRHGRGINRRNPFRLGAGRSRHSGYLDQAQTPCAFHHVWHDLAHLQSRHRGWHIIWSDPLNQDYSRQIGRPGGKDIVQVGEDSRGFNARWRFTEIAADSFHWIGGERSSTAICGKSPTSILPAEPIPDTLGRSSRNRPYRFPST